MVDFRREHDRSDARDEALAWFVRMNSGDATAADRMRFDAWLGGHPRRRQEYERLGGIWTDLEALPDPRRQRSAIVRRPSRRQLVLGAAAAAGIGVAVPLSGVTTALASDFRTATAERKAVTASDGTQIELDAGTAIADECMPGRRRLRLLQGRAMFTVADGSEGPLDVACLDGRVRAAAATFTVHRRADDVAVIVDAGTVLVTAGSEAAVPAGQRITYAVGGLGRVQPMTDDSGTAWRRGKLVFHDRPLDDVVADLNRYRAGRIVIGDRSLAMLRLDGIFDTSRPDAALEAIINTLPVRAFRLTDYLVVLRRAAFAL